MRYTSHTIIRRIGVHSIESALPLLAFLVCFAGGVMYGQHAPVPVNHAIEQIQYSPELSTPKHIRFGLDQNANLRIGMAPEIIKTVFALDDNDAVVVEREFQYVQDMQVTRYERYHKGIKVEHGDYSVLSKAGQIQWINAEHYDLRSVDSRPGLDEASALQGALTQLGAELYAWQATDQFLTSQRNLDPGMRQALEQVRDDEYPVGELVYVRDFSTHEVVVDLAYKFIIESVEPLFRDKVYVNARDGHIMLRDPQIKHGIGDTRYAGTRTFPTTEVSTGVYELKGVDPLSGITCDTRSLDGVGGLPLSITVLYTLATAIQDGDETSDPCILEDPPIGETGDDNWSEAEHRKADFGTLCCPTYVPGGYCNEVNNDDTALDAHWGASIVAQYWKVKHNRNSFDDAGSAIFSFVHYGDAYDNAFWNGSYMTYGDGSWQGGTNPDGTFAPLSSLDVCAHEIGHAICTYTSDLVYEREAGAMNEGFSDIWAAAIERYVLDSVDSSLPLDPFGIGEQIDESDGGLPPGNPASRCLRWMDDPKAEGNPDTYGGANWSDPECLEPNLANDYCGVHNNSGVLNKWYYLLTVGSGQPLSPGLNKANVEDEVNDNGDSYHVVGLGSEVADMLALGGEMLLTPNAKFADMREASIQVARLLFGTCSFEEIQTTNAWHAVGVGDTFVACVPRIDFNSFNPSIVSELGDGGTGCVASSSFTLGLFSFMATQTIHLVTSGNAIQGVDYDLDSMSLSFDGDEVKYITLTIYDDDVVESLDTIIISFDNGGFSASDTVIIRDDDVATVVGGTHVLLTEAFSGDDIPAGWQQQLVNTESANHWEFNGLGTEIGRAYASIPGSPSAVYDQTADAHIRLVSPLIDARGKRNVTIEFDWEAGGETDAVDTLVLFDYGSFQISLDGSSWQSIQDFVGSGGGFHRRAGGYLVTHPELDGKEFYLGFRWYNDALVGSGFSFAIDNVEVSAQGLSVATAIGALMETGVPTNTPIGFVREEEAEVIAIVDQAQGNLGCTSIGISANNLNTDVVALSTCDFRSSKVFEVLTENTSDTFELTLYFSGTEVDAWNDPAALNLLAVADADIDNEESNVRIVDNAEITVDDQLAGDDNYIAYTFSTVGAYQTYALTDHSEFPINRVVMNTLDAGVNSLRDRIAASCPADTIRFDAMIHGDTIHLAGAEIVLDKNLVIAGPGMDLISISGNQSGRVFHILPESEIHLYDVELRDGNAVSEGGAILNGGHIRLTRVRMRENFANGVPSAILNNGVVHLSDTVIIDQQ